VTEVGFGSAVAVEVPAGASLAVTVARGRQVADIAVTGLHQGLTRNAAGWRRFGRPSLALWLVQGDRLLDGDGRPLMEVAEAPPGSLDAAYPGCWREIYPDGRDGCRDLLADALGLTRAALPGILSAFGAAPRLADGGVHGWEGVAAAPGTRVVLTALRWCRVAVSACPDDGIPGAVPGAVSVALG